MNNLDTKSLEIYPHDRLVEKCISQFGRILELEEENRILRERLKVPIDSISLVEMERRHIETVLATVDGNKSRAAKILGVHRRTLYRRLG